MTVLNLDEANRRIEELETQVRGFRKASEAKGRLLVDTEEQLSIARETVQHRGETIEALVKELCETRATLRDAMQELLTICRLAGAKLPERITESAKAAGFDV